jgi:hypothetical protein
MGQLHFKDEICRNTVQIDCSYDAKLHRLIAYLDTKICWNKTQKLWLRLLFCGFANTDNLKYYKAFIYKNKLWIWRFFVSSLARMICSNHNIEGAVDDHTTIIGIEARDKIVKVISPRSGLGSWRVCYRLMKKRWTW